MKKNPEEEKIKIIEYFESLNLKDWKLNRGYYKDGGQAAVIEVQRDREIGVFRKLFDNPSPEDKNRFKREVRILENSEYKSPYIVEILDSSKDDTHYWYISRKGSSFKHHWNQVRNKYEDEPDKFVAEAIAIVKKLATGLIKLHKNGVVHRDIKMPNVVMQGKNPQLIDFGIAFIDGEERLTPSDGVAANQLSPLSQYYPNSGGEPWHDVFLLSQILIAMLSLKPIKNWQGALDWRWVLYPRKMSKLNVTKIRAVTGICSNPYLSPKDAEEFITFLDSMFMDKKIEQGNLTLDFNEIRAMLEEDKALDMLKYSDSRQMYEDGYYRLLAEYKKLQKEIVAICTKVPELPLKIKIIETSSEDMEREFQKAKTSKSQNPAELFYCPRMEAQYYGDRSDNGFLIIVEGRFIYWDAKEKSNKFAINLVLREREMDEIFHRNRIRCNYHTIPRSDGKFGLYDDEQEKTVEAVLEIDDLLNKVKDWLNNEKVWKLAFKKS